MDTHFLDIQQQDQQDEQYQQFQQNQQYQQDRQFQQLILDRFDHISDQLEELKAAIEVNRANIDRIVTFKSRLHTPAGPKPPNTNNNNNTSKTNKYRNTDNLLLLWPYGEWWVSNNKHCWHCSERNTSTAGVVSFIKKELDNVFSLEEPATCRARATSRRYKGVVQEMRALSPNRMNSILNKARKGYKEFGIIKSVNEKCRKATQKFYKK